MFKQVKVKVISNDIREITVAGISITSYALLDFTPGKVYDAELLNKGDIDYDGIAAFEDNCLTFINDKGERCVAYLSTDGALELVEEGV